MTKFELLSHPEWEIHSSVETGPHTPPRINLYVVGPRLGEMPFHISMTIQQAETMIDSLMGSCRFVEREQANADDHTKQ